MSPSFKPLKCAGVSSLTGPSVSCCRYPNPTFLVPRRCVSVPSSASNLLVRVISSPLRSTRKLISLPSLKMMSSVTESRFPRKPFTGVPWTWRILSPSLKPASAAGMSGAM